MKAGGLTVLGGGDEQRSAGRASSQSVGGDDAEHIGRVGAQTRHRVLGRADIRHLTHPLITRPNIYTTHAEKKTFKCFQKCEKLKQKRRSKTWQKRSSNVK